MEKLRLRLMVGLAGATLAFAATSYAQNTNAPATGGAVSTQPTADQSVPSTQQPDAATSANQAAPTGDATIGTSSRTTTTATDVTTTTPSGSFWLGPWGIAAIAVVALLLLWAIFGRRDRTVVRDTYSTSSTTRTGTVPPNERVVSPRAASGTETTTRVTDTDTRL